MKRLLQVTFTDQEYEDFMEQYTRRFIAGKCNSKSDFLRQLLGFNNDRPGVKSTKDAIKDKPPIKKPKISSGM